MIEAKELKHLINAHLTELKQWLSQDLDSAVSLLNRAADGALDLDDYHDAVSDAHDLVMSILFSNAWNDDHVPNDFWNTDMGQVMLSVRFWLEADEMITKTEAAQILRGSSDDVDLNWLNRLIRRENLTIYTDPNEPNPQRATRLSRAEVERLKK